MRMTKKEEGKGNNGWNFCTYLAVGGYNSGAALELYTVAGLLGLGGESRQGARCY